MECLCLGSGRACAARTRRVALEGAGPTQALLGICRAQPALLLTELLTDNHAGTWVNQPIA